MITGATRCELTQIASRLYGSGSDLGIRVNMMGVLDGRGQGVEAPLRPLQGLADAEGAIQ